MKFNFLKKEIKQFLLDEKIDLSFYSNDTEIDKISAQAELGLIGKDSSLPMIDTKIYGDLELLSEDESLIVVDAGGTHLRVVVTRLKKGKVEIEHLENHRMPGVSEKISKNDFYDQLIGYLRPVLKNHSIQSRSIQFCFSYPTYFNEKNEVVVKEVSKEIQIEGIEGALIDTELIERLHYHGYRYIKSIVVLNDTTATLLAGKVNRLENKSVKYASYVGLVLGTGFNIAYEENFSKDTPFIVNTECGSYSGWIQTSFDRELDRLSKFSGIRLMEKKVSGKYLGPSFLEMLKLAYRKKIFIKADEKFQKSHERFCCLEDFPTDKLSLLLDNFSKLEKEYQLQSSREFQFVLQELAVAQVKKSAHMVASMTAAFILRSLGVGINSNSKTQKVCLNLDGSVIQRVKGLKKEFKDSLERILSSNKIEVEMIQMEHSPIIGSAIARYIH